MDFIKLFICLQSVITIRYYMCFDWGSVNSYERIRAIYTYDILIGRVTNLPFQTTSRGNWVCINYWCCSMVTRGGPHLSPFLVFIIFLKNSSRLSTAVNVRYFRCWSKILYTCIISTFAVILSLLEIAIWFDKLSRVNISLVHLHVNYFQKHPKPFIVSLIVHIA